MLKRILPCPQCKKRTVYSDANLYRPFCSKRCQDLDILAWASEDFAIAGEKIDLPDNTSLNEPQNSSEEDS